MTYDQALDAINGLDGAVLGGIRELGPGASITLGGGAAPAFTVRLA